MHMSKHWKSVLASVVLSGSLLNVAAFGQGNGGMGAMPLPQSALDGVTKVLAGQAFSSKAHVTAVEERSKQVNKFDMAFAVADGKMRIDLDLAKIMKAQGQDMEIPGLDKMFIVARPDQKCTYMIIPGFSAYAAMPVAQAATAEGKPGTLTRTELGEETVSGLACKKMKNTYVDGSGKKTEALTWEATALKGAPIKMTSTVDGTAVTVLFSDINQQKPAAALFEPPAGFTKCASMQEMMMAGAMKMMTPQ